MNYFQFLKKIYHLLSEKRYYFSNQLIFYRNKVSFDQPFIIKSIIKISNDGTKNIGKGFRANSGRNFNPIGGDTVLRLICEKNAFLQIGDNCGISNSTIVAKQRIEIGNNVMIGGGCRIWDTDFHSIDPEIRSSGNDLNAGTKPIRILDYAFIGGGSIILKGVTIGCNAVIAAGSIVSKDVPDDEIWGGNPARFLKKI